MSTAARPVVSFLIATDAHNGAYLEECLDSIWGQSFIDTEILLLDPSATPDRLARYTQLARSHYPFRLVETAANTDPASHYNAGIRQAKGDLIWILPAGHCLASPHVVQDFVTQFMLNPALGVAFCRAQHIDEHSRPYESYLPHKRHSDLPYQPVVYPGPVFFRQLLKGNVIPAPGAITRTQCCREIGLFEPELGDSADWYNWLRFALEWDVYFEPAPKLFARKPRSLPVLEQAHDSIEHRLQCYRLLENHLRDGGYAKPFQRQTQLAKLQFMRKQGCKMSLFQSVVRIYRKLTVPAFEFTPV